jgi:L-alanine-DL-glutamate epimerase-like enolase superfamily enzyme
MIYDELKIPIILDESFTQWEQFEKIQHSPETWVINLRISKMGGLLRSLSIANKAKELKIPIIIGAQVDETSILSRAAPILAHASRDHLIAQE